MRLHRFQHTLPWLLLIPAYAVVSGARDAPESSDAPAVDDRSRNVEWGRPEVAAERLAADPAERPANGALPANNRSPTAAGIKCLRTSMRFDASMTLDNWKHIGARIGMHSDATCWWLGDWLAFGKRMYGLRYREGIALTGLEYKTLRNYAVVARAFESSRRRHDLSFQHHAEVCALPREEQDFWLDLAVQRGWSKSELRRRVRARAALANPPSTALQFALERSRHDRWREAAERSQCTLREWVTAVLDDAANTVLEQTEVAVGDM